MAVTFLSPASALFSTKFCCSRPSCTLVCDLEAKGTCYKSSVSLPTEIKAFLHSRNSFFRKKERYGWRIHCQSTSGEDIGDSGRGEQGDIEAARRGLENTMKPAVRITGKQLRETVVKKYGRPYDVRLTKFNNRVYLQVMWRFLGQRSFHLTEDMYNEQLDAVAEFLTHWGVGEVLLEILRTTKQRPGFTGGGGAKAVSIPLNISRGDGRGNEWMDHF